VVSAILFYIASIHYARFKSQLEVEKEDAEVKASNYNFSDANSVQRYGQLKPKHSGSDAYMFVSSRNFRVVRE